MANELTLPEIGENITQGTVTKVLVKVGDSLKKGQNILELETDKAVVEIPSNGEGTISEILVKAGDVIKIGQPVFKLGTASAAAAQPAPASTPKAAPTATTSTPVAEPAKAAAPTSNTIKDLLLPALGENLEKGTVTKVLVKSGDAIKKGQNIVELETDKAVLEVPSPEEGLIKEILIKAGDVIKVGQAVFKILAGAAAQPSGTATPKAAAAPSAAATSSAAPSKAAVKTEPVAPATGHMPVRKNVPAAPSVRLFAREIGIDIGQVTGSGPAGRISIDDVKKFSKALNLSRSQTPSGTVAQPNLPDFSKWGSSKREAMSNVRRKTAEHLSSAWNMIPHVTQCEKVNITELEKIRKAASTEARKLSVTSYLIKILAVGLKKFPQFNSSVDMTTHEVIYKDFVNIGVAVDTDRGLLVPVLKNVDRLSVTEISDQLTAIAEKARNRKTSIEDLQGGTFTISNLGGIGGSFFTPIVNWPEVAILGVSRGVMEPVYVDGQFVPRLMLPLSLSYDHRIVDGADGARFIRWIAQALEQPASVEGLL